MIKPACQPRSQTTMLITVAVLAFCLPASTSAEEIMEAAETQELEQSLPMSRLKPNSRATLKRNPFARSFTNNATANASTASSGNAGNTANANGGQPKLRAVLYAEKNPLADINGKIVGLGEDYEGFTVKIIGRDHITLEKAGQLTELSLQDAMVAGAEP